MTTRGFIKKRGFIHKVIEKEEEGTATQRRSRFTITKYIQRYLNVLIIQGRLKHYQ